MRSPRRHLQLIPLMAPRPRLVLAAVLGILLPLSMVSCSEGGAPTEPGPQPAISVGLGSASLAVAQGQSNTVSVAITRTGGFEGAVSLSLQGAPDGVTGTFSPASLPAGSSSSTLTLSATTAAAVGAHQLSVRARGEGVAEQSAALALTVAELPSVVLAVEPGALSVTPGTSESATITISRTNFTGAVELSLEGAPAGVSGAFDPASLAGGATTSTLTLTAAADAAIGASELVLRAHGEGIEARTQILALTVESPASWSALGERFDGPVHSLAVMGSELYAGGRFRRSGLDDWDDWVVVNHIARWDGSRWSALGEGLDVGGSVHALAVMGNHLYVGGNFTTAGGMQVNNIARWDGSRWSALGEGVGVGGSVYALAVMGNHLYVGGNFTTAGGMQVNNIARWDGSNWTALGEGLLPAVSARANALAVIGNDLYVGGFFTYAGGGVQVNNIARWDGSSWFSVGPNCPGSPGECGVNAPVHAMAVMANDLYLGGQFSTAGWRPASRVAKWDGSAWSALGGGASGGLNNVGVRSLAVMDNELYAGTGPYGGFSGPGGPIHVIGRWDGSSWSALSGSEGWVGEESHVFALASQGRDLFIGRNMSVVKWSKRDGEP